MAEAQDAAKQFIFASKWGLGIYATKLSPFPCYVLSRSLDYGMLLPTIIMILPLLLNLEARELQMYKAKSEANLSGH